MSRRSPTASPAVRTWAYIAHRADWLAEPEKWAERTREIEEKLSDALHQRLTQRFVDRRTAVLMRDLGARGLDALPVTVAEDGAVAVDGEPIGQLDGFRFRVDHATRHGDMKRLLAAAERRLGGELARRARALAARRRRGIHAWRPIRGGRSRSSGAAHIVARLAARADDAGAAR